MNFENFNMLDRVVSHEIETQTIVCETTVPQRATILDAHFPGFPILPGVFMVETIAQASGLFLVLLNNFEKMAILFGIENARFRDYAKPGETLQVHSTVTHIGHGYGVCDGKILRDDKIIAQAEVRLRLLVPDADITSFLQQQREKFYLLCNREVNEC